jgi:serine protease Do
VIAEKQRLVRYKIDGGVKVLSIDGGKFARSQVEEGFIITKVNGKGSENSEGI